MSYDLMIGKSPLARDKPLIVGALEIDDYHVIAGIAKRHPCWLLDRLLLIFEDQCYSLEELQQGVEQLDRLLLEEKGIEERGVIFKVSAIFSMALRMGMPLHGVAD